MCKQFHPSLSSHSGRYSNVCILVFVCSPSSCTDSIAVCQFASRAEDWYAVVGTGRDVVLGPRTNSGGSLILYQLAEDGRKLKYLHTTPLDDVPLALEPFNGRLLVGVGKLLRIYDIGKKKMLRKCENKVCGVMMGA